MPLNKTQTSVFVYIYIIFAVYIHGKTVSFFESDVRIFFQLKYLSLHMTKLVKNNIEMMGQGLAFEIY